jgi:hypothetical protein
MCTTGHRPLGSADPRVLCQQHFMCCENDELWKRQVEAVLGDSDFRVDSRSRALGGSRWRPGHLISATRPVA